MTANNLENMLPVFSLKDINVPNHLPLIPKIPKGIKIAK